METRLASLAPRAPAAVGQRTGTHASPIADPCSATKPLSFDHRVGASEWRRRQNFDAEFGRDVECSDWQDDNGRGGRNHHAPEPPILPLTVFYSNIRLW